jgi:hypothetical protein
MVVRDPKDSFCFSYGNSKFKNACIEKYGKFLDIHMVHNIFQETSQLILLTCLNYDILFKKKKLWPFEQHGEMD